MGAMMIGLRPYRHSVQLFAFQTLDGLVVLFKSNIKGDCLDLKKKKVLFIEILRSSCMDLFLTPEIKTQ